MKRAKFEEVFEEQCKFFTNVIGSLIKDDPEYDIDEPLYHLGFVCDTGDVCFAPVPPHIVNTTSLATGVPLPDIIRTLVASKPPPEAIRFESKIDGRVAQGLGFAEVVMHWSGGWVKNVDGERTGEEILSMYLEDRDGNIGTLAYFKTPDGATTELVEKEKGVSKLDPDRCGRMQNFFSRDSSVTEELAN